VGVRPGTRSTNDDCEKRGSSGLCTQSFACALSRSESQVWGSALRIQGQDSGFRFQARGSGFRGRDSGLRRWKHRTRSRTGRSRSGSTRATSGGALMSSRPPPPNKNPSPWPNPFPHTTTPAEHPRDIGWCSDVIQAIHRPFTPDTRNPRSETRNTKPEN